MPQFYTVLTDIGQAKMANAIALGTTIEIAAMAVGDGGGTLPNPDSTREALVNELRRAAINRVEVDADNPSWLIVEQVLPPDVGGWTIREVGIFDTDGDLVGYGNYPETYKPTLDQGSGRTLTIRMVLEVSHTAAVTLRVDPSVVLATRKYADDQRSQHEQDAEAHAASQITISKEVPQAPGETKLAGVLAALGAFAADCYQNIAVFDTAGTTSWSVPDVLKDGRRKAHVTVIGGGGGGGRDFNNAAPGGGGGGVSERVVDLSGVESVSVTVGAGGAGAAGTNGQVAGVGGSSSFGSFLSATGGGSAGVGSGGRGGQGVGGDFNTSGGGGGGADKVPATGSGGVYLSGHGGGAGGEGRSNSVASDGPLPVGPGGGGAGAVLSGNGASGAAGIVIVRY